MSSHIPFIKGSDKQGQALKSSVKGSQLEIRKYIVGYRSNRLDESVFTAVPKLLLTEFGIHHRSESVVSCNIQII